MARKQKGGAVDNAVTRQMRVAKAEQDILEYRRKLRLDRPNGVAGQQLGIYHRTVYMGGLAEAYKEAGQIENMKWACGEVISYIKRHRDEIPGTHREPTERDKNQAAAIGRHFKNAHFLLAPYSFHHYLLAMEWNFAPENKFYTNRFCVMKDWAEQLQKLEDGDYEILGLSAPPRSGKTGIGTLFLTWNMGRHPEKSMIFATHTSRMSRKEYFDILTLITDPRREWNKIFPGLEISQSAEDLWIDVSPKKSPNNYKTIYCTSIDASKAGVMEASWLIYCDDLIGGIEEAMNPERLNNAWTKYGVDIIQRKNGPIKILHIATRWSVRDPLTRVESMNEGNPRAKFICVPGLDENGESNFNFPYNPLDKKHFETMRESMDEVSFSCIVMQRPIERDGLVFTKDSLLYYEGILPEQEPDEVVFAGDIAFGGGDYLCMPVGYVYNMDVYIHDVIFSKATKETTKPMVTACILSNKCTRGYMEANAGGSDYAADIDSRLREQGYRCNIESRRAPVTKSKLSRILDAQSEIKGLITDGSGYRFHFLSPAAQKQRPMYRQYMEQLLSFNQSAKFIGKQGDDAADATAMLVNEVLNRKNVSGTVVVFSRRALAI